MRGRAAPGAVAAAVVLPLLAAGCLRAPDRVGKDLGVSRSLPVQHAVYTVDWWTQLVPDRLLEYGPRELASPALYRENEQDPATDRLIVGTRDGILRSVGEGGRVFWSFTTKGPFEAGPTVHGGDRES